VLKEKINAYYSFHNVNGWINHFSLITVQLQVHVLPLGYKKENCALCALNAGRCFVLRLCVGDFVILLRR